MEYWLRAFSGRSWQEFVATGCEVVGFRDSHRERARGVKVGDLLVCYLLRVKRWVGLLEVTTECFEDEPGIDEARAWPVRFQVRRVTTLSPEHGVPMESLEGKLSFYPLRAKPGQWIAHVRRSLTAYGEADGRVLARAIQDAAASPISRPVDPKKLLPSPKVYRVHAKDRPERIETVFSIPAVEQEERPDHDAALAGPSHTEIQWRLLDLGSKIGFQVWAPKSDRHRTWDGHRIRDVAALLEALPPLFNVNPPLRDTIANIDVLWLKGGSIEAAFEVEHTTSVYSGLLRMSDLVTISPMISIKLYLVAPDDRYEKFMREIARPTFASRERPLHTVCRFLPYSTLCKRLEEGKSLIRFLEPRFLDDIAELYDPSEEVEE